MSAKNACVIAEVFCKVAEPKPRDGRHLWRMVIGIMSFLVGKKEKRSGMWIKKYYCYSLEGNIFLMVHLATGYKLAP